MIYHVYVGYDSADFLAYQVAVKSLLDTFNDKAGDELKIYPMLDPALRKIGLYSRPCMILANGQKFDITTQEFHSTDFTFSRFLVPKLHRHYNRAGPALFVDADVLFCTDVRSLINRADKRFDVMVSKANYSPIEDRKLHGVKQQLFNKKNWASVMLFPDTESCPLSVEMVNNESKLWLHQFEWALDSKVGNLPESWNWLEGHSSPAIRPDIIHFTRGTPDVVDHSVDRSATWWAVAKSLNHRAVYQK